MGGPMQKNRIKKKTWKKNYEKRIKTVAFNPVAGGTHDVLHVWVCRRLLSLNTHERATV